MWRVATISAIVAVAALCWRYLSFAQFGEMLQPAVVAISIMAAALLVRLNRGMPTLEWKSLEPNERKVLTQKVVELSREYMVVLAVQGVTLIFLLVIAANKSAALDPSTQRILVTAVSGLLALCVARMSYIVWRDYDIVRLQKKLIDESADRESVTKASDEAAAKLTAIRGAGLRGGTVIEPGSWKD